MQNDMDMDMDLVCGLVVDFCPCLGINKHLICDLLRCIMQIVVVHKLRKLYSVCRLN